MKWIVVMSIAFLFGGYANGETIDVKKYIASRAMVSKVQNYRYHKAVVTNTNSNCMEYTMIFPSTSYQGKVIHPKQRNKICIQGNRLVDQKGNIVLDASEVWMVSSVVLDQHFNPKEVKSTCRVMKKYTKTVFNKNRSILEIKCEFENFKSISYMIEGVGATPTIPID